MELSRYPSSLPSPNQIQDLTSWLQPRAGVFVLSHSGRARYVGQTTDLLRSVSTLLTQHGQHSFTRLEFHPMLPSAARVLRAELIAKLHPDLQGTGPGGYLRSYAKE